MARFSPDGKDITIVGNLTNLNYYIKTDAVEDAAGSVTNETQSVKSFTRRRFAGDSEPVNVSGHSRTVLRDPGRRNGAAEPGKPFILDDGVERRKFRYIGDLVALHAYLTGDSSMAFVLYSPSASYLIPDSTDDEGQFVATKKKGN